MLYYGLRKQLEVTILPLKIRLVDKDHAEVSIYPK